MKIEWQTAKLDAILQHYVDGFKPRDGDKIFRAEWFVDLQKGEVVFRLIVDNAPDNRPG